MPFARSCCQPFDVLCLSAFLTSAQNRWTVQDLCKSCNLGGVWVRSLLFVGRFPDTLFYCNLELGRTPLEWNRPDSNRLCGIFRFHYANYGYVNCTTLQRFGAGCTALILLQESSAICRKSKAITCR